MARPRHSGERYRGGRLRPRPQLDAGSDNLIAHRAALVGTDNARDPLAGYPLGVARLRGIVCRAHLDAGLRYAILSAIVWGNGRTEASHLGKLLPNGADSADWERPPGSMAEHERWRARKEVELRAAVAAVRALPSSRPWHLLENVIVYEHRPRFLDTISRRGPHALRADLADRAALDQALGTLATLWGMKCE